MAVKTPNLNVAGRMCLQSVLDNYHLFTFTEMTKVGTRSTRAAYVCVNSSLSPYAQTVTKHGVGFFEKQDKTDWQAEFSRYGDLHIDLLAADTSVQQKRVGGCLALRCMSNELRKVCLRLFDLAPSVCSTYVSCAVKCTKLCGVQLLVTCCLGSFLVF